MKTNYYLLVILPVVTLSLSACGPRNPSLSQLILGKWNIESMNIDNTEDPTREDSTPFVNSEGWIKFHTDKTFDSSGEPLGIIDGEWTIDEESEVLSITVNQNLSDKSTWDISVEKKKMEWSNATLNVSLDMTRS